MNEELYYLGFSVCPGIGPIKFALLQKYFGSVGKAWEADEKELVISGIGRSAAASLIAFRKSFNPITYAKKLAEKGINFTIVNGVSLAALASIPTPPFLLYTIGDVSLLNDKRKVAVVGTRKMTQYGSNATETFVAALVHGNCTIISGLALGIDAAAHQCALDCGGRTIAVLGSGVDVCTPMENDALYKEIIASGGLIVSEAIAGMMPVKGSFPARNRIIAGLSEAVLVPEGAVDSGSLITANFALEFGRKVYAIPGPITSRVSQGPYALIEKGAKMVIHPNDMLKDLDIAVVSEQKRKIRTGDNDMQKIIDLLEEGELYPDEIIKKIQISSQHLGSLLSIMEMNGWIGYTSSGKIILI